MCPCNPVCQGPEGLCCRPSASRRELALVCQYPYGLPIDQEVLDVRPHVAETRGKLQAASIVMTMAQRRLIVNRDLRLVDGDFDHETAIITGGKIGASKRRPVGDVLDELLPKEEG